jgi:putative heme-binding domain-containing protein
MVDDGQPSHEVIAWLSSRAGRGSNRDRSPLVQLYLVSALQRIPVEKRWEIAMEVALASSAATPPNETLLIWYGLEPLVTRENLRSQQPQRLLTECRNWTLCRLLARRMAEADLAAAMPKIALALSHARPEPYPSHARAVLGGVLEAVRGLKHAEMPQFWEGTSKQLADRGDPEVRAKLAALGLLFGDPRAESGLRSVLEDRSAAANAREFALQNLVDRRIAGLPPLLFRLLDDPRLRGPAIRALATYNDPATPGTLLERYASLSAAERDDAIATMASRPAWAAALIDAIGKGAVPRRDVYTTVARQILAFGDPKLTAALEKSWGTLRPTARDKAPLIAKYKAILAPGDLPTADPDRGRNLFGRMCGQCHKLYGEGGDIGPDLTGSDRANPDYILENVLDPSATVGKDFTLTTVATVDGRLIAGIIREQSPAGLVIQTASERITVPREDVETIKPSNISMMPEGQLDPLTPQEIRDLFAYLATSQPTKKVATSGRGD